MSNNKTKERFEISYVSEEHGATHGRIVFDGVALFDFWIDMHQGYRALKYADSDDIIGAKIRQKLPETPLEKKTPKQKIIEQYIEKISKVPGGIPGGIFRFEKFDPIYFAVEVYSKYGDSDFLTRNLLKMVKENEVIFWKLAENKDAKVKFFQKDNQEKINEFLMDSDWYMIEGTSSFDAIFDSVYDVVSDALQPSISRRFILSPDMKNGEKVFEKPDMIPMLNNVLKQVKERKSKESVDISTS